MRALTDNQVTAIYDFAYDNEQKVFDQFGVDFVNGDWPSDQEVELGAASINMGSLCLGWYSKGSFKFYGGSEIDVAEFEEFMAA